MTLPLERCFSLYWAHCKDDTNHRANKICKTMRKAMATSTRSIFIVPMFKASELQITKYNIVSNYFQNLASLPKPLLITNYGVVTYENKLFFIDRYEKYTESLNSVYSVSTIQNKIGTKLSIIP